MTKSFQFTLVWLAGSFIAILMSLNTLSASLVDGSYIPVSNDSFYHARRILDAAADPNSFFEYDTKIHVPEGSQITWPWTYDYLLAAIVRTGSALTSIQPTTILAYIPVAALAISIGLIVGICIALNLSVFSTLLATLCVALSPLTQVLHGVGIVDHHFAEYIFVLATLWAGLRWLNRPDSRANAVVLGCVLGLAPGFHNGLFILQIPAVITVVLAWLRDVRMPLTPAMWFGGALLGSTLLIAVPSEPFRQWQFEFYLLSWFHLYIAFCSAASIVALAVLPRSKKTILLLASGVAVASLPLLGIAIYGTTFVAGDLDTLKNIAEVKGISAILKSRGLRWLVDYYSGLVLVIPIILGLSLFVAVRKQTPLAVRYFAVASVGALVLLAMQFRFHPYGSFALFLPLIAAFDHYGKAHARQLAAGAALTLLVSASYALPVKDRLFAEQEPGNDVYYGLTRSAYPVLRKLCSDAPGVVLAGSDAGNYIRYHTDCSVIANNFLLTPQHAAKVAELNARLEMTPDELLRAEPRIRYVLITLADIATGAAAGGVEPMVLSSPKDFAGAKPALAGALMSAEPNSLGPRYRLLMDYRYGQDGIPLARLYEILPAKAVASSDTESQDPSPTDAAE